MPAADKQYSECREHFTQDRNLRNDKQNNTKPNSGRRQLNITPNVSLNCNKAMTLIKSSEDA